MPWENVSPMEQKQRFVSLAVGHHFTMTELCLEFGISRKTGHKWMTRYQEGGMKALEEHSHAPKSVTCRTEAAVERLICGEKRLHPTWGPKKIHGFDDQARDELSRWSVCYHVFGSYQITEFFDWLIN